MNVTLASGMNKPLALTKEWEPGGRTESQRKDRVVASVLLLLAGMGVLAALVVLAGDASAKSAQPAPQGINGGAPGAPEVPAVCPSWNVVPSPSRQGVWSSLDGVAAISATNIWAVGYSTNSGSLDLRTLTEHWDGNSWTLVPSPNRGVHANSLSSVAASSASNVWAVGSSFDESGGVLRTLTEHWDGNAWSIVPSPNVGTDSNQLYGVAVLSASNAWAVGYCTTGILILHWNGTAWIHVSSPSVATDASLYAIDAISANNIWAIGYFATSPPLPYVARTLILHWNGSAWSVVTSANANSEANVLLSVYAVSAGDVWAVGYYKDPSTQKKRTLTEHWNGSAWAQVPGANVGTKDNELNSVAALSATNIWAVGYYDDNTGADNTLVLHWTGSAWSGVYSPNGDALSELEGVAAISTSNVWAVGYSSTASREHTLVERYYCPPPATSTPIATHTPTPHPSTNTPLPLPSQCAINFADVPNPSTFYPYIQCLACRGIIGGYACGGTGEPCDPNNDPYFRPTGNLTRGQIVKILAKAAGITDPVSGQSFQDVPVGSTFYTYTQQLHARGVMSGFACGGTNEPCVPPANLPYFRPGSTTTRGQLAKLDSNTAGFNDLPSGQHFQDIAVGSTYYTYTTRLATRGVMSGFACGGTNEPCVPPANLPYFRPSVDVKRGQTSKIVANTFYPNCQAP